MKAFRTCCTVVFAACLLAAVPAFAAEKKAEVKKEEAKKDAGSQVVERGWTQRCIEPKKDQKKDAKKQCEIFQRMEMKSSSMRVAEFAVGFPETKDKDAARGVIILPLGILLEEAVTIKIDDGKGAAFKIRYCTNAGCFAYINLDKGFLETMKKGKKATLFFKTLEGQNVNLIMNLNGFDKALKDVQ